MTITENGIQPKNKRPRQTKGVTTKFRIFSNTGGDTKGYVQTGEYEDGTLCEIFVKVAKQGSTIGGLVDAWAITFSHALQNGSPLEDLIDAAVGLRFEPFGETDDPNIPYCTSIVDYVVRLLAVEYCPHLSFRPPTELA